MYLIKIHTIDGKKAIQQFFLLAACIIILYVAIKTLFLSSPRIHSYSEQSNILFQTLEQHVTIDTYKQVLTQAIPPLQTVQPQAPLQGIVATLVKTMSNIDIKDIRTIIGTAVPFVQYTHAYPIRDMETMAELSVDLRPSTKLPVSTHINPQDVYFHEDETTHVEDHSISMITSMSREQMQDIKFLQRHLYTFNGAMALTPSDLPIEELLQKKLTTDLSGKKPKILIFHSHSQEAFVDSRTNKKEDQIIGVGQTLVDILQKKYSIAVLHHTGEYDIVNGKLQRGVAYQRIEPAVRKILRDNPSIEVAIDIHRDGVNEDIRLVTEIDGKPTAKIMYFNGICKQMKDGKLVPIEGFYNPYINENLAFSLQMQLMTNALYPSLARKIYIKEYRYSLHMLPKSLLIEVGAQTNTVQEAKNAMEPLAKVLVEVLKN